MTFLEEETYSLMDGYVITSSNQVSSVLREETLLFFGEGVHDDHMSRVLPSLNPQDFPVTWLQFLL